jgi:hypothetical protein
MLRGRPFERNGALSGVHGSRMDLGYGRPGNSLELVTAVVFPREKGWMSLLLQRKGISRGS